MSNAYAQVRGGSGTATQEEQASRERAAALARYAAPLTEDEEVRAKQMWGLIGQLAPELRPLIQALAALQGVNGRRMLAEAHLRKI